MMTGKTRYYNLGKYQKNDVVDIESDWNSNFSKIDTQMKKTADQIEQYTTFSEDVNGKKSQWDSQIQNWREELNVAEAQLNENAANAVTAKNVAQNAKATAQKASADVGTAISTINSAVAKVNNVKELNATVQTGISGLTTRIEALEGKS